MSGIDFDPRIGAPYPFRATESARRLPDPLASGGVGHQIVGAVALDTPLPKPQVLSGGPPEPSELQMRAYVRRSLWQGIVFIVVLVAAVAIAGVLYEEELLRITQGIYEAVGLFGLLGILFVSDSIFSPVPPDLVLLVLSRTEHHAHWPLLVLLIGALSVVAGWLGWFLGGKVGNTRFGRFVLGRSSTQNTALVKRYGRWAIALGAFTPIPFSITCWLAGMYRMPFTPFAQMTLLRIPRFFLYYFALAYGDQWLRWLFA